MSFKLFVAVVGVASIAGCNTAPLPQAGSLDAGFGETTRYNAAVQIINPDPVYAADGAQPGDSGEKAAKASTRYRTDQVKETRSGSEGSGTEGGGSGPR